MGEWHTQVDATCITAATMPRPTDRRLAVPCSGGALDDRVVAPPTAPTGASLPPEHRSHQSIAPTGAPLPLEHRSHRSHGHGSRHGAPRRPTISGRSTRRTSGVYRSCPPLYTRRPVLRADGMVPRQTRTAPPRPRVLEPAAASQRRSLPGHEITNLTVSKAELTFTGAHNHERRVIPCPTTKHECSEGPVHSYA